MKIRQNVSLKPYNTFGVDVKTDYFVDLVDAAQCQNVLNWAKENQQKILLIGGGSNLLLVEDWIGLTMKVSTQGIEVYDENEDWVYVEAQAGVNWHDFVQWTLDHNFGGVENLSLIPGNVGTAPIQNIGAYGVEISNVLVGLSAVHIQSGEIQYFTKEDCKLDYRDSIFKNSVKNQYIIWSVRFELSKKNHQIHTDYGDIQMELQKLGIKEPRIQDVSQAIINIRKSKLPDPSELGNSGSFFKNPLISQTKFEELKKDYPEIVAYPVENLMKIAAGWLIEKAGWKGKRVKNTGVHEKQALVLVNYGNASGKDILELSENIIKDIQKKFGITLEREVNLIQNQFIVR